MNITQARGGVPKSKLIILFSLVQNSIITLFHVAAILKSEKYEQALRHRHGEVYQKIKF